MNESGSQCRKKNRHLRLIVQAFAQNLLGARMAFAAASADIELSPQLRHRRHATIDRLADLAVGNVIAYADYHRFALLPCCWLLSNSPLMRSGSSCSTV